MDYVYEGRDTITGRALGDYLLVGGILCAAAVLSTLGSIGGGGWVAIWSWSQAILLGELARGYGTGVMLAAWATAYLAVGVFLWFLTERIVRLRSPGRTWVRAWLSWSAAQVLHFVTLLSLISAGIVVVE